LVTEAEIEHNGSLERALEMVDEAAKADADTQVSDIQG
jgi:sialic acid synthase SpsE